MDKPDMFAFKKHIQSDEAIEYAKKLLPNVYDRILLVLDTYMDMKESDRKLVALWIVGSYFHKEFPSFPRLYINAMKGSGKSRLLQILKCLCWNGTVQTNLTESVLFRTANTHTLLFDESESIGSKEKSSMRELLNAGYKKGTKVTRMKKLYSKEGESQVTEEFDLYGPVALANISGMDDVLGDRCISIVLEKSKNPRKTRLIEDFDENIIIKDLKFALSTILVYKCSVVTLKNVISGFNLYTLNYTTTLTTQNTQNTLYNLSPLLLNDDPEKIIINEEDGKFFNRINRLDIDGRNLELFFPLFALADSIKEGLFDDLIQIAVEFVNEKNKEDRLESQDWSFIEYIAKQPQTLNFVPISSIVLGFRDFYGNDNTDWLNSKWVGRAFSRLGLSINKRRVGRGVEHVLNVAKAQEKLKMFKNEGENDGTD